MRRRSGRLTGLLDGEPTWTSATAVRTELAAARSLESHPRGFPDALSDGVAGVNGTTGGATGTLSDRLTGRGGKRPQSQSSCGIEQRLVELPPLTVVRRH